MAAGNLIKTTLQGVQASGLNVGDGVNVLFAASDYKHAREQGNSKAVSLGKAGISFAWGEFFYGGLARTTTAGLAKIGIKGLAAGALSMGVSLGAGLLMSSGQIASSMWQHNTKEMGKAYNGKGQFGSGYFNMTESGYTMRQRSLNAIHSNGLNTQSALGNEARTYFRSSY